MSNIEISFDVAALTALLGTSAFLFHRKVVLPLLAFIKEVGNTKKKIDKIYTEMAPNGGSTIRDAITRIEMRLVGVEQKQNVYLLEAPAGMFESNQDGRFISVNRTLCTLVGRIEGELTGMGWINSVAEEDRDRVFDKWTKCIKEKMEYHDRFNMKHKGGEVFSVNAVAYPMEHPNSKAIIGWLGTITKSAFYDEKTNTWK
jgi:PAS domain S-box-containing protein